MAYTFNSKIDYETIIVDVLYEGVKIGNRSFSTVTYTEDSAIADLEDETNSFGFVDINGKLYPAAIQTPEPDPPVNPLQENMDSVMSSISQINDSISPDMFNINIEFMSDDDVLKKMIITQSSSIPEERISEETADQIVAAYPNNHPTKTFIKDKKKEVKRAAKQLGVKGKEITLGTTQLTTETIASFATIISSATILPFGAGLPTAFSAVQGLFASLKAFQTKLNQLEPVLESLKYVEMLVPENDPSITSVNTALGTVNGLISGVAGVISPITQVQSLLGSTSVPGVNSDPVGIVAEMTSSAGLNLTPGQHTWLNVTATQGTWQYDYWWSAPNDPNFVTSNQKSQNVYPTVSGQYACLVKNKGETTGTWCSVNINII